MRAGGGGDGWHGAGRPQAGGVCLPSIFAGSLLKDLNHGVLLYDFGVEILNAV